MLRPFLLCRCLDLRAWQCLQAASLLFVLFGPDIVSLKSAPDSINPIIDALLLGSMGLFMLDLSLSVLCQHKLMWLEVHLPVSTDSYFRLMMPSTAGHCNVLLLSVGTGCCMAEYNSAAATNC